LGWTECNLKADGRREVILGRKKENNVLWTFLEAPGVRKALGHQEVTCGALRIRLAPDV
jgi:hypothetical protein